MTFPLSGPVEPSKYRLVPDVMPNRPTAATASNEPAIGNLPQTQSPRRFAFEILSLSNVYKAVELIGIDR